MTEGEVLVVQFISAQAVAVALGAIGIAAADWSCDSGHIRRPLYSVWVSCSVTMTCLPILVWASSVFLGSGINPFAVYVFTISGRSIV